MRSVGRTRKSCRWTLSLRSWLNEGSWCRWSPPTRGRGGHRARVHRPPRPDEGVAMMNWRDLMAPPPEMLTHPQNPQNPQKRGRGALLLILRILRIGLRLRRWPPYPLHLYRRARVAVTRTAPDPTFTTRLATRLPRSPVEAGRGLRRSWPRNGGGVPVGGRGLVRSPHGRASDPPEPYPVSSSHRLEGADHGGLDCAGAWVRRGRGAAGEPLEADQAVYLHEVPGGVPARSGLFSRLFLCPMRTTLPNPTTQPR